MFNSSENYSFLKCPNMQMLMSLVTAQLLVTDWATSSNIPGHTFSFYPIVQLIGCQSVLINYNSIEVGTEKETNKKNSADIFATVNYSPCLSKGLLTRKKKQWHNCSWLCVWWFPLGLIPSWNILPIYRFISFMTYFR